LNYGIPGLWPNKRPNTAHGGPVTRPAEAMGGVGNLGFFGKLQSIFRAPLAFFSFF
jgi:hypothetical protein